MWVGFFTLINLYIDTYLLDYSPGQDVFHLSHHVALCVLINNASPLFPFPQLSLPFFPDTEDVSLLVATFMYTVANSSLARPIASR